MISDYRELKVLPDSGLRLVMSAKVSPSGYKGDITVKVPGIDTHAVSHLDREAAAKSMFELVRGFIRHNPDTQYFMFNLMKSDKDLVDLVTSMIKGITTNHAEINLGNQVLMKFSVGDII